MTTTTGTLSPAHRAMLEQESGITEAVIEARGYRTSTGYSELKTLGIAPLSRSADVSGLLLPLHTVEGKPGTWFDIKADCSVPLTMYRPDMPQVDDEGRIRKYLYPKGVDMRLDCPPLCQPALDDPHIPLWITEGQKKADALVSHDACALALLGVWNFRGRNAKGGKTILSAWQYVDLERRDVRIVYDSDVMHKEGVAKGLEALVDFLVFKGARVHVAYLPSIGGGKVGVDDYLLQHTLTDLENLLVAPEQRRTKARLPHRNGHAPAARINPDDLLTDTYNARALIREHGHTLRYCYPWKTWLVWTGTHWQRDTSGTLLRLAKQTIRGLAGQAAPLTDDQAVHALLTHVKKSLSTAALKAMLENAQSEEGIPVHPEAFDTDPWRLNCTNGTLDLRTGALQPHRQDDLITKGLPIAYDADAQCPAWEAFLWRIMGGSQGEDSPDMSTGELEHRRQADDRARALIGFLQRAIGYTLTGSTREQCLFILHGPTKTGKSTFLATLRALLGPYGQQADMESFMHKDKQEVRNDLADLAGSRFVCALEGQEGRRLAESLVKQLTGGTDSLKARFLFQEHFTFKPQFKVFLGSNHKPVIKDTDSAIWERIRLVPFTVQIPQPERDKALDERLQAELPGILAWAMRGCLEWQRMEELGEPDAVREATAGYRDEMDTLAGFLEECCVMGASESVKVKASALANAYQAWCKRTGELPLTNRAFIADLERRNFIRERGTANQYYWHGLNLVNTGYERYE